MIPQRSFQAQISKCYRNPEVIKLINQQLLELVYIPEVKSLGKFTIVRFKVPSATEKYKFTVDSHFIQFYFVLGRGFPLLPPRVHVKEGLIMPGINDLRDLIENVTESEIWNPKTTLKQIQQKIPEFLSKLNKNEHIFYNARLGTFKLNSVYPMSLIKQLRDDNIFFALQFMEDQNFKMVVIDVSATHIAIFTTKEQPHYQNDTFKIPQQGQITYTMLVFYAELGSLTDIYIDRNSFSDVHLSFSAKKPHNLNLEQVHRTKRFKVKKGLMFIHKIMKGIKYYDPIETHLTPNTENISEQQKFVLKQIKKAQETIQHHLNIHTIRQLADRYQSAVEFYSSQNIPYYETYLDCITKFYQRPEIKTIMQAEPQPQVMRKGSDRA